MECGRERDRDLAAKTERQAGKRHHQNHDSGAASSAGEGAPSSSESARTSQKESESSDLAERHYVQAVLDCYRSLPGTATVTSRHDRKCARALFRRGIPLGVVLGAMVVAVARRTFRRGDPLPRIRALHFFLPVIEELLDVPCDPGYVQYLKTKLEAHAGQEIQLHRGEPRSLSLRVASAEGRRHFSVRHRPRGGDRRPLPAFKDPNGISSAPSQGVLAFTRMDLKPT